LRCLPHSGFLASLQGLLVMNDPPGTGAWLLSWSTACSSLLFIEGNDLFCADYLKKGTSSNVDFELKRPGNVK